MKMKGLVLASLLVVTACVCADGFSADDEVLLQEQNTSLADEQAFSARLSDQNRHAFFEVLNASQRQSVMVAVQNGAKADEAVAHMLLAQDVKISP